MLTGKVIRFGVYQADLVAHELRKGGTRIRLQPKPFHVLTVLLERAGAPVSREELKKLLWAPDTFVDFDHGLNATINKIRDALNDSAENPKFIETLSNGYRFIGAVEPNHQQAVEVISVPTAPQLKPLNGRKRAPRFSIVAIATACLFLASLTVVRYEHAFSRQPRLTIKSIAVLPLRNLSGDHSQDYFSDSMTDELITQLAKTSNLRVVSSGSTMRFKNSNLSIPEMNRDLKVDAFVEGSVLRSDNDVRITAQLIDASTDRHIWADDYHGELRDILVLQNNIAAAIADKVRARITASADAPFTQPKQVDPRAYDAYLKGRGYWFRSKNPGANPDDLDNSGAEYRRAIQYDPNFAPAYGGLADYYGLMAGDRGIPAKEGWVLCEEAAQKALKLDESLGDAYHALATKKMFYEWNWAEAELEIKRGLERDPRHAELHNSYSHLLAYRARFDESIAEAHRAEDLDPLGERESVPRALRFSRRFDLYLPAMEKSLSSDPAKIHESRAMVYQARKEYAKAVEEIDQQLRLTERTAFADLLRHAYETGGYKAWLQAQLADLNQRPERDHVSPLDFAMIYAAMGNTDKAMQYLERGYVEHTAELVRLQLEPAYDGLHSDPRFRDLVRRIGLPENVAFN
jgi:TolB-like protein/DNA-binding winged helix-turn-helix (wHTH) protein